jgi:hypothetical protein
MNREELLNIIKCCGVDAHNYKMDTAMAWIRCMQRGSSPIDSLLKSGIYEIVVYGITELGELLVSEALLKKYKVLGITDRKVACGGYFFHNVPVISRDRLDNYKDKYIVITSMMFWEEIEKELRERGYQHIATLRELM